MRLASIVTYTLLFGCLLTFTRDLVAQTCTDPVKTITGTALTTGLPVITANNGISDCVISSSKYLDATQFMPGTDICTSINSAYGTLPVTGGTIDARGFIGVQNCTMNPFTGTPRPFLLLLGAVQIITEVPWITPFVPHRIVGVSTSSDPASLITPNNTLIQACGQAAAGWSSSAHTCVNTSTIQQFPNATNTLSFASAHGPFVSGTYAPLIAEGGIGAGGGVYNWATVALGGRIENVFLDCGGNANCFAYYTQDEQERSGLFNVGCGNLGSHSACAFWDNSSNDNSGSQIARTTHFSVHDVSMSNDCYGCSVSAPDVYGLVMEGAPILLTLTGGSGSGAQAYVSSVSGGVIGAATVTAGGSGYGVTSPTCSIFGTRTTVAMCSPVVSNGIVTGIMITSGGSGYATGLLGGGPDEIANVTVAGRDNSDLIADGIWIEGFSDPYIGYVHCEYFKSGCVLFGSGNEPTQAGFIHNVDTANSNNPVVHIGFGVDKNAQFRSIGVNGSGTTNVVQDDQNGVVLMSPTWQYIPEYLPGGHPVPFTPYVQPHNFRNWGSIAVNGGNTTLTSLGDSGNVSAAGGGTAVAATSTEPPLINLATSGNSGNSALVRGDFNYLVGANILFQEYAVAPDFASGMTNPQRVWIGITDSSLVAASTDTPTANFAAFRYSTVTPDTTWQCVMGNGTSTTVMPSTVAVDTNGHRFEIQFNDSIMPAATFKIDGNPVCTSVTTNYPVAGKLLETWTSITALSAATRHIEFSYLDAYQDPRR